MPPPPALIPPGSGSDHTGGGGGAQVRVMLAVQTPERVGASEAPPG